MTHGLGPIYYYTPEGYVYVLKEGLPCALGYGSWNLLKRLPPDIFVYTNFTVIFARRSLAYHHAKWEAESRKVEGRIS